MSPRRVPYGSTVEFGRVRRKTPAIAKVRSPTTGGAATVNAVCNSFSDENLPQDLSIPTVVADDLLLLAVWTIGAPAPTSHPTPAGWTLGDSDVNATDTARMTVFYKKADGTETTVTVTQSGGAGTNSAGSVWAVGAQGLDFTANPPTAVVLNAYSNDPPSVSPSTAPAEHLVFAIGGNNNTITGMPAGYTEHCNPIGSHASTNVRMAIAVKRVDITTSEDPGTFTMGSSAGNQRMVATVAVLSAVDPELPAFNHTHVEADITNLAHTDANAIHDNVAGEIAAITAKATPVSGDRLLIEDSAASNAKKSITIGDLPGGVSDHGALTGLTDDDHTQYLLAAGTRAATFLEVSGLTGATASSPRFVGGTLSGAPASGTFALGDYVVTEDGNIYVCTTAGSPGTWTAVGAAAATDANAIHDNVASEISALTLVTAASGDHVLIEDASDSNNKKRVAASDFLSGGGGSSPEWVDYWAARVTGETAHTDDQFYTNGAAVGTTVTPTGTATWVQKHGGLEVVYASQSASDIAPLLNALTPSAAPVSLEVGIAGHMVGNVNNPGYGVCFTDGTSTTSNVVAIWYYTNTSGARQLATLTGTLTNVSLTNVAVVGATVVWPIRLVLVWTAANTWAWAIAGGASALTDFNLGTFASTMTPTHFGPFVTSWTSAVRSVTTFGYTRVDESNRSV